MHTTFFISSALVAVAAAASSNATCPLSPSQMRTNLTTIGICPSDLDVIGPDLEAVHESVEAPTGLAVDSNLNIFFTYARNMEEHNYTLTKATSFNTEVPWPSEAWQNCVAGQNASECFVNVQNVVLDSLDQFWIIDSGVPHGASFPLTYGPKIMIFNYTTGELVRNYVLPKSIYYDKLQLNDIRVNNTLGYAFITDDTAMGSITTLNLDDGTFIRHLYNSTFTKPDSHFTSMYDGQPIRDWNGTTPSFLSSGSNGIALASGNLYWAVKASHRYYFISQSDMIAGLTDEQLSALIQVPGNLPSETAGFTADDRGRLYCLASEQNAILYLDTLQSEMTDEINGVAAGGSGLVPTANYVHKTFARSGLIQAADTAAILDGWLYFTTNQQGLSPRRQYNNIDKRVGPFRSYRIWIGRGPAV